jgi:Domain of unknown function (DUF1841)
MTRSIDFKDWLASAEVERRRVSAVEAAFAEPYRRERARDVEEADFLRRRGTAESLTGPSSDDAARRAFAAPRRSGFFGEIDLALLDPADRDDRRLLIEAEHSELADALEYDEEVVTVDGEEINPRLHVTVHEIIAEQLWQNDPPEAWTTAKRLLEAGYERHEIFHMLGSALVPQIWRAVAEGKPSSSEEYLEALAALPGPWEPAHGGRAEPARSRHKLAVKARKAARKARKRNRKR